MTSSGSRIQSSTEWAKGVGREGLRGRTPDALHTPLCLGRVTCQEVAEMIKITEHALSDELGIRIGCVTAIRACCACGTSRAAHVLELRFRAVMTAAAKGEQLGKTECGLPTDNRVRPAPNPPLMVGKRGRRRRHVWQSLRRKRLLTRRRRRALLG